MTRQQSLHKRVRACMYVSPTHTHTRKYKSMNALIKLFLTVSVCDRRKQVPKHSLVLQFGPVYPAAQEQV